MADPVSNSNSSTSPTPYEQFVGLREKLSESCLKNSQSTSSLTAGEGHSNLGIEVTRGALEGMLTFGAVTEGFTDIYHLASVKVPFISGEASHYYAQARYAKVMQLADEDHMNLCGPGLDEIRGRVNLGTSFLKLGAVASSVPFLIGLADEGYQMLPEADPNNPFGNLQGPTQAACNVLNDMSADTSGLSPAQIQGQIDVLRGAVQVVQNSNTDLNVELGGQHPNSWLYDHARPVSALVGVGVAFGPGSETIKGLYGAYWRRPVLQTLLTDPLNSLKKQAEKQAETDLARLIMSGRVGSCDKSAGKQDALDDWAEGLLGNPQLDLPLPETKPKEAKPQENPVQPGLPFPETAPAERSFMDSLLNPDFHPSPVLAVGPTTETLVPGIRNWFWDGNFPGVTTRMPSWLRLPSLEPAYALPGGGSFTLEVAPLRCTYMMTDASNTVRTAPSGRGVSVAEPQATSGTTISAPVAIGVLGTVTVGLNALAREWGVSQEQINKANGIAGLFLLLSTVAWAQKDLLKLGKLVEFAKMLPGALVEQLPMIVVMMMGSQAGRAQFSALSDTFGFEGERRARMEDVGGFVAGPLEGYGVYRGVTTLASKLGLGVTRMAGGFATLLYGALTYGNGFVQTGTQDIETSDVVLTAAEEKLKDEVMSAVGQKDIDKLYALSFDPAYADLFTKIYADVYNALNRVEEDLSQFGRRGDVSLGTEEEASARVAAVHGKFESFRKDLVERFATSSSVEEPAEDFLQTGNSLGSEESVYPTEEENVSYVSSVDAQGIEEYPTSDTSECYDEELPQSFEDDEFGYSEV